MCGIVGILTKRNNGFTQTDTDLFQQALIVDSLRGLDSTGMFSVTNHGDIDYMKVASHPFRLLQNREAAEMLTAAIYNGKALVGHNRKATSGRVVNENAHPFVEGHIILVHNGAIHNAAEVAGKSNAVVEVDSHLIAHLLAKEDDVAKALGQLNGAFAVVWYDQKKHSLNLVRNSQRPLFIAEFGALTFFGSEEKMLEWLCERNHMKTAVIREVPIDTVISFSLEDNTKGETSAGFKKHQHTPFWEGPQRTRYSELSMEAVTESAAKAPKVNAQVSDRKVIFKLLSLEPKDLNGVQRYQVFGKDVRDGGVTYRAWLPSDITEGQIAELTQAALLQGISSSYVYKNGKLLSTWISGVQKHQVSSDEERTLKTFNGVCFSVDGWYKVAKNCKCKVCRGNLDLDFPKYTAITMENNGTDVKSVICPPCLEKKFKVWSETERDWVLNNNKIDPREYILEREILDESRKTSLTVH